MHLSDLLWSLLVIFFMIMYFMLLFSIVSDLFRSDKSGAAKTIWVIALLFFPLISILVYTFTNGSDMTKRAVESQTQMRQQQEAYVRSVVGDSAGGDAADQIKRGADLLASGAISQAEFDALKAKALS
jgi:hypothetical protein